MFLDDQNKMFVIFHIKLGSKLHPGDNMWCNKRMDSFALVPHGSQYNRYDSDKFAQKNLWSGNGGCL